MAIPTERLSQLQHRTLAHDKGNLTTSLKGLVTITWTPGGLAEAVDLTPKGRERLAQLPVGCE